MIFESNFVIFSGPHREFAKTPEEAAEHVRKFLAIGCAKVEVQATFKEDKRRRTDKSVTNTY